MATMTFARWLIQRGVITSDEYSRLVNGSFGQTAGLPLSSRRVLNTSSPQNTAMIKLARRYPRELVAYNTWRRINGDNIP